MPFAAAALKMRADTVDTQIYGILGLLALHAERLDALEQLMMELHPDGREAVAARLLEARRGIGSAPPADKPVDDGG